MGYFLGSVFHRGFPATLKASAAETTSTTHNVVNTKSYGVAAVTVAVTAASGTSPTLSVVVEGSLDGSTWFTLGTVGSDGYSSGSAASAPANFTGAATTRAAFPAPQYVRTRSVVAGTSPSFTYSVEASVS